MRQRSMLASSRPLYSPWRLPSVRTQSERPPSLGPVPPSALRALGLREYLDADVVALLGAFTKRSLNSTTTSRLKARWVVLVPLFKVATRLLPCFGRRYTWGSCVDARLRQCQFEEKRERNEGGNRPRQLGHRVCRCSPAQDRAAHGTKGVVHLAYKLPGSTAACKPRANPPPTLSRRDCRTRCCRNGCTLHQLSREAIQEADGAHCCK